MSPNPTDVCLTSREIAMINTIALNEPVSGEVLLEQDVLAALVNKGYVEKIHQTIANIDRYRLSDSGILKYRQLSILRPE